MPSRLTAALSTAAFAVLSFATSPAFAAPDANYLQNQLDGRGRCLGTAGPAVAMIACDKSPTQQWFSTRGALPGFEQFHTVADGASVCLAVHQDDSKNMLAMEPCSQADRQQWYVVRVSEAPRVMRMTNRETGATRCLEAVQTGMKMTPCSRHQNGHSWYVNYEPTM
jgi:hypothetical protein